MVGGQGAGIDLTPGGTARGYEGSATLQPDGTAVRTSWVLAAVQCSGVQRIRVRDTPHRNPTEQLAWIPPRISDMGSEKVGGNVPESGVNETERHTNQMKCINLNSILSKILQKTVWGNWGNLHLELMYSLLLLIFSGSQWDCGYGGE